MQLIKKTDLLSYFPLFLGTGRVPDQQINLDMKHGVEAKNYEEVCMRLFFFRTFGC